MLFRNVLFCIENILQIQILYATVLWVSGLEAGKCQKQCKQICWYINKLSLLLLTMAVLLTVVSLCRWHAVCFKMSGSSLPVYPAGHNPSSEVKGCIIHSSGAHIIQFDVTCFLHSLFVLLHNQIEIEGSVVWRLKAWAWDWVFLRASENRSECFHTEATEQGIQN